MSRKLKQRTHFLALTSAIIVSTLFVQPVLAGCDTNYFKTTSRQLKTFWPIQFRDWTGDGHLDVWFQWVNPATGKMEIVAYPRMGSGDWDYNNPVVYLTDSSTAISNYKFVDYDHDGKTDIFDLNKVIVYKNDGAGNYYALSQNFFPEDPQMSVQAVADLNNDGIEDIVVVISGVPSARAIGYRLGNAAGNFGGRVNIVTGEANPVIPGDFNGDGKIDLITHSYGSTTQYRMILNNGKGGFNVGSMQAVDPAPGAGMNILAVRDMNNDAKLDAVVYTATGPNSLYKLYILYGNGNGTFTKTEYSVYKPTEWNQFAVVEFNGDNKPDLLGYADNHYFVQINNGSGNFTRYDYQRSLGPFTNFAKFIDLNEDGRDDLFNPIFNSQYIGNIFGEWIFHYHENVCQSRGQTTKADFDGDGQGDMVRWNPSTGVWTSVSGKWYQSSPPEKTFTWGSGSLGDVPSPGDFDGDGITDYAVYRNSTGVWYINQSSNGSALIVQFGLPGDIAVPNDYNGGGSTDIAVFRPSDGNWYVWYSETQQFYAVHFGTNGDKPVPADFDGDGKTDFAVYRPAGGLWYYLRSSDGNWGGVSWGLSTDTPVPADYDGDGRADITVVRNPGDWYMLRSSDNTFNFLHWGTTGDVPIPFYRHSLAADLVVYRPATWEWYNYWYHNNTTPMATFGALQNVPVKFGLPNN